MNQNLPRYDIPARWGWRDVYGLLAKIHLPNIDIRKPYTEIMGHSGADRYSGRWYDEQYIQRLMGLPYRLPINSTTAFLRRASEPKYYTQGGYPVGRPPRGYVQGVAAYL